MAKKQKELEITLSKWVHRSVWERELHLYENLMLNGCSGGVAIQTIFLALIPGHTNHSISLTLSSTTQHRKDQKKVDKLTAQIPYHEGRGNKEEVEKIKSQVEAIWTKTREAAWA